MLPSMLATPALTELPLDRYVAVLRHCFSQRDDAHPIIEAALRAHRPDRAALRAHMRWQPGAYTRNLLHREDRFELLVMCWDFDATSPVHDHGAQRSWTQVIAGTLALETFDRLTTQQARQSKPSAGMAPQAAKHALYAGDIDFRDRSAPAHRLSNPVGKRQRAVSLHIYARPLREFTVYNPRTGAAERRAP